MPKPCAPEPLEREKGRGGERERGDGVKEGEREREGRGRGVERVQKPCVRPTATPLPLTTARSVVMSYLPPAQKMFRKSFETSLIISSEIIKFARKIVLCKSFSIGKKSNFKFESRGYFEKKKSKSP